MSDYSPETRVAFALHMWTCHTCVIIDPELSTEEKLAHVTEYDRTMGSFLIGFLGLKEEAE